MLNFIKDLSRKTLAWLLVIAAIIVIGIPTAIAFGAADAIFESPGQGVITFFIVLGIGVLFLVVEFGYELLREKKKRGEQNKK
ncbi:MAG: hypothetical protein ACTII7_06175 [Galactobacter sp.]